jgi:acetamidase/formamidase
MTEHLLPATRTHSRWNRDLPPQLTIEPGDIVHFDCLDSTGGQLTAKSTTADFIGFDRSRIHALTGPVFVRGVRPNDILQIDLLTVEHLGWGWTGIHPGLGLLPDMFSQPELFLWELIGDQSRSLEPALVPLQPFCGIIGVAPAESGEFRTRCPGQFGGNMDVRELTSGATLFLPVFTEGALLSIGDVHAAQGDGEVCLNGIECPANVTVRITIHPGQGLAGPFLETTRKPKESSGEWVFVESNEDIMLAARQATIRMIDFLVARWSLTPQRAYALCSVAMNLRLSQVVNAPTKTVSASLSKGILP